MVKARAFWNATIEPLANLYDRWLCEREYEDFADYVACMRRWLATKPEFVGIVITKMTKRPFGLTFVINTRTYVVKVTQRQTTLQRTK